MSHVGIRTLCYLNINLNGVVRFFHILNFQDICEDYASSDSWFSIIIDLGLEEIFFPDKSTGPFLFA